MGWRVPGDFDILRLYAVLSRISDQLADLSTKVESVMTQSQGLQAKLDSITGQIGQIDSAVNRAVQNFRDEISSLSSQGVDTSGLEAAVSLLNEDVSAATTAAAGTVADAGTGADSTPGAPAPVESPVTPVDAPAATPVDAPVDTPPASV